MKKFKWLLLLYITSITFSNTVHAEQEGFIGQIKYFAGNFAPRSWAFCDGQLLQISQYTALFAILGTTYGGDGRTTFALPDMRGRTIMSAGNGPGLPSIRQGDIFGSETETMTRSNLPSHTHPVKVAADAADSANAADGAIAEERMFKSRAPNVTMDSDSVSNTGSNDPINNVQPVLALNCIIALQGTFPPRS